MSTCNSKRTWKQLGRDLGWVLLLVFFLDRLIGAWLLPLYRPEQAGIFRSGIPNADHAYGHLRSAVLARADMLIVGSSRALTHYDDQLLSQSLGLKVYNAGSPGLGLLQARVTLALAQRQHPIRYLLLDAVYIDRENRMCHRLEPWLGQDPVVDEVLASDWRERLKTRSFAYRCGGSVFDLIQDYGKAGAPWGFRPLTGELKAGPATDLSHSLPARMPDWYVRHLHALAQDCRRSGVQLMFVFSPAYAPDRFKQAMQPLQQLYQEVAQTDSLPILTPCAQGLAPDCYSDDIHLNAKGARIFSRQLAQELQELGWGGRNGGPDKGVIW